MQQSQPLIPGPRLLNQIIRALSEEPVTVLLGTRQTGKTTLAGMVADKIQEQTDTLLGILY